MLLQVLANEGLQEGVLLGVEAALGNEVVGQAAGLVERPSLEGGDELALVDHSVLQGQQPKQELVVGSHSGLSRGRRPAVGPCLDRKAPWRRSDDRIDSTPAAHRRQRRPAVADRNVLSLPRKLEQLGHGFQVAAVSSGFATFASSFMATVMFVQFQVLRSHEY
jgi:hypothetical protein